MLLNPIGTLTVVRINPLSRDPALLVDGDDAMDLRAYADTRDPKLIREKAGMRAVRFEMSPLDAIFVGEHIDSKPTDSERSMMTFLSSCLAYTDEKNQRVVATTRAGAYGQPMADEKWIRSFVATFGMSTLYELAAVAWMRTRVPVTAEAPLG